MITGRTGLFALLGSPVEHSLSPAMHNASFARLGLDYVYLCHDVTPATLGQAMAGVRAMGYAGLNVTMPCKAAVIDYLDELSPAAELMGAVNTVKREGDRLIGHNTDGAGLLRSVTEASFAVAGSRIVVIGAGGAGSAVFTQAALDGAGDIAVFNLRDDFFDATRARLDELAGRTGVALNLEDLADKDALAESVASADIVVDATRVGMAPLEGESNLRTEWMRPGQAIVDTVYHPRQTKLLRQAAEAGAEPIEGLGMLLWQAAIAEEIWLGASMPVDDIRDLVFD
ncbi:MAG: shikimate dehydrogenase [Actinomycetaceae bacterium]|nr:shikimate dehydrogenase [Actinomycetaceae bacterium]